jgi:hypothetical protein
MYGQMSDRRVLVLLLCGLGEVFAFDDGFPVFREFDVLLQGWIVVERLVGRSSGVCLLDDLESSL